MTQQLIEQIFTLKSNTHAQAISGKGDENLRWLESQFSIQIFMRGMELTITGESQAVNQVMQVLRNVSELERDITAHDFQYAAELARKGATTKLKEVNSEVVVTTAKGKQIRPKTVGQCKYAELMRDHEIVFSIGPAGTGKTYLAMAVAVAALKRKEVSRLILTRPAVEAGESLGFLPGDLQDKIDPYLRPLYDALYDILGQETYLKFREKGIIEIAPLAYMRGRTLDDSFIILDEAQNTTQEQMKMFLTRLGFGSRAVVTGDITQVDLPRGKSSGLIEVTKILGNVEGVAFSYLSASDVVRHPLVQRIIRAYESYDELES